MDIELVATDQQSIKLVDFTLGGEDYGIPIESVKEIIRMPDITVLPNAPEHVLGIINLRGVIIPILSLAQRFGMTGGEGTDPKVMVIELRGTLIGLQVSDVSEVLNIDRANISDAPAMASSINRSYIAGVGKVGNRLVVILNLARLLESEQQAIAGLVTEPVDGNAGQ